MFDNMFLFAVGALGWGLSLATYTLVARTRSWPMGALQSDLPVVPVVIGIASITAALMFASFRGADGGGWIIVTFGLLFAIFWTGFLRVGSQVSLFLAPLATALLALAWFAVPRI